MQGGTLVELHGLHFRMLGQIVRWGLAPIPAGLLAVLSSSLISIVTPAMQDSADVTVQADGSPQGVRYEYVPEGVVESVVPS